MEQEKNKKLTEKLNETNYSSNNSQMRNNTTLRKGMFMEGYSSKGTSNINLGLDTLPLVSTIM
jgi:hypothetical protein